MVGILGCLDIDGFDFRQLVEEYKLLNFIKKQLRPGATEDDMVLEVVILVGTVLTDPDCAPLVASSGIVQLMIDLLKAKQEDDEIVLQVCEWCCVECLLKEGGKWLRHIYCHARPFHRSFMCGTSCYTMSRPANWFSRKTRL